MIGYQILRELVFEVLKAKPETQYLAIMSDVRHLAARKDSFPTEKDCKEKGVNYIYYREKRLNPIDELNVYQIIWDLIIDRVLTIGSDTANEQLPFLRLTEFGRSVVEQLPHTHYDPDGYVSTLESFVPELDSVIKQYALEGLHCFRQRLFFASAVMFGAAAEKAVLLLLKSIGDSETNQQRKEEITELLERPRLPRIFEIIRSILDHLIKEKTIPYSIHQGSTEHILSLFEMIRVHRNDAVHPVAEHVNKTKVFLTIQSLPTALEVLYRLIKWFKENKI